jgi:hypothetical protein
MLSIKFWFLVLCSAVGVLSAREREIKSPAEIEKELEDAQAQLNKAKKMFNPWYAGPLITPAPSMCPPGYAMYQPYVFATGNYGRYNQDRRLTNIPDLVQLKTTQILQFGVTNSVDILASPSAAAQWQSGDFGGGFDDLPVNLGFLVYSETPYFPQIKFNIQETFPTGKYQRLSANGLALNGLGQGSYQTSFGLGIGKLLFWTTPHPINTRAFVGYNIPTPVKVHGFNVYGGGYGTKGTVQPGKTFSADVGIEFSITQQFALALDIAYTATNATKFKGNPGTTSTGAPASVGSGFNDNLSLAPALEYSWSDSAGLVAGTWFSVYGRNSLAFVQGIVTVYILFPVL